MLKEWNKRDTKSPVAEICQAIVIVDCGRFCRSFIKHNLFCDQSKKCQNQTNTQNEKCTLSFSQRDVTLCLIPLQTRTLVSNRIPFVLPPLHQSRTKNVEDTIQIGRYLTWKINNLTVCVRNICQIIKQQHSSLSNSVVT